MAVGFTIQCHAAILFTQTKQCTMIWAAFILGITGSLHCVGMCGPIALLIQGRSKNQYLMNRLTYHVGRTVTYMAMGAVVGFLGTLFRFGGMQSVLSLTGGAIIILFLFLPKMTDVSRLAPFTKVITNIKLKLGSHLRSQKLYAVFLTGVLNGFLPCGLVYSALALSLVQLTVLESMMVMGVFGLGTIPALLAFTYSANFFKKWVPFSASKLQRLALVVVALIMIWRGVVFSFPEVFPGETTTCHSPAKAEIR